MRKKSFRLITFLLMFPYNINGIYAQSNISIQKNDTLKQTVDSLKSENSTSTNSGSFCGCESVEKVKNCIDCFQNSGSILKNGYEMSYKYKTIVRGSCWGFVNAVYNKSGVSKETIFSSKKSGPYVNVDKLKPGDWIYHVNYSYGMVEHSAIFVCWKDKNNKQAITLSYAGQNRSVPGRLSEANLKGVYSIFRAK